MDVLALDISTHTGWAFFRNAQLVNYGMIDVQIEDFNIKDPTKSELYPMNIINAANKMAHELWNLIVTSRPHLIVLENTVKGKNRNTQRVLEFIHKALLDKIAENFSFVYMDPSEWRSILNMRLSKEDKKNNCLVSQGKKRGRITKKHLSVSMANNIFNKKFKIKDNNMTDAILLGHAFLVKNNLV